MDTESIYIIWDTVERSIYKSVNGKCAWAGKSQMMQNWNGFDGYEPGRYVRLKVTKDFLEFNLEEVRVAYDG